MSESPSSNGHPQIEVIPCGTKGFVSILHISDTHNEWVAPEHMPPADILIHTGDFSHRGKAGEFQAFNFWLGEVAHLYPVRIVVLGNHDTMTYGKKFPKMVSLLSNATHVPNAELFEVCGLRMLSLPYLKYESEALQAAVATLSEHRDIDILLTHAPAYGVLDLSHSQFRCGSKAVAQLVQTVRPTCHLFGHVHEQHGFEQDSIEGVLSVNSSLCDHPVTGIVNAGHIVVFDMQHDTVAACCPVDADLLEDVDRMLEDLFIGDEESKEGKERRVSPRITHVARA